jgi:NAD(P)-dependent dehydrogenase (short-subunit alcohol dehydrogenase family)
LAETVNRLYKAEVIHRLGPWRSFEAVEHATLEWVDWFNHRQLLEPIGNISPAEAEELYYAAKQHRHGSVTHEGGVLMLTKATATDLAKYGIRCNCYCPGAIDTATDKEAIMSVLSGAHLIRRLGRPDEIAKLACFLASDDSSFVTGASYAIDGGTLAWRGVNA